MMNNPTPKTRIFLPVFVLLMAASAALSAQNRWIGGTPGAESDWNTPRNWSQQHVPYWGDQVVIVPNVSSSSGYFPVVDETVEEIPYLLIEAGAYLVITDSGQLTINGETTYNYGLLNAGELINEGELFIFRTAMPALGPGHGRLTNQGVLAMDDPAQPVRYAQRN